MTAARLHRAFEIFQEFGPERAKPIQERWKAVFADATPEEMRRWEALFREVEAYAYGVAEHVLGRRTNERGAAAAIARQFPQLSQENVDRALSQALYFASK